MRTLLLLARNPGIDRDRLAARLHPDNPAPPGVRNLDRYRELGLTRVACMPNKSYTLTETGYALCAGFRDNEYPAAGIYNFP